MSKDFGIKVSADGNDVSSATDPNTVMSSNFVMLKVFRKVVKKFTHAPAAASETVSIPHDLGYPPAYLAYIREEIPAFATDHVALVGATTDEGIIGSVRISKTDVTIVTADDSSSAVSRSYTYTIYLLSETAVLDT